MKIVSVVIPNYNKGPFLQQSLDSLMRQTYADWEAIVVDDCSTDDSWTKIQDYARRDARFRVMRNETNRGGCYSRNLGAKMAQGEYLIFLDSDDWLADDCLEQRAREFAVRVNAGADMLVFPMGTMKCGKQTGIWNPDRGDALAHFLRHDIPWSIMMPVWRRATFERMRGFDEAFPRLQDVELHTRALLVGVVYRIADRASPDCFYFIDEGRMTTNQKKASENFIQAVSLYVEKMRRLIMECNRRDKKALVDALQETVFQALRNVGDCRQSGKITRADEIALRHRLLTVGNSNWQRFYRCAYDCGLNRLKGFNFLFRRAYRVWG